MEIKFAYLQFTLYLCVVCILSAIRGVFEGENRGEKFRGERRKNVLFIIKKFINYFIIKSAIQSLIMAYILQVSHYKLGLPVVEMA